MSQVNIEIISVVRNKNAAGLVGKKPELKARLDRYGYTLTGVKNTVLNARKIRAALDGIAKSDNRPDVVIIANALSTTDSTSFRKYFVETVAEAEHSANERTPKDYWKREIRLSEKQKRIMQRRRSLMRLKMNSGSIARSQRCSSSANSATATRAIALCSRVCRLPYFLRLALRVKTTTT